MPTVIIDISGFIIILSYYIFNFIDAIYVLFVDDRLYFSPIITLLSLLVGLLP